MTPSKETFFRPMILRTVVFLCCLLPAAAMHAQAPISNPSAPAPPQRPTGTFVPPGFSPDLPPRPTGAPNPALQVLPQMETAVSASFDPENARVGWPVEYTVTIMATDRVMEIQIPKVDGLLVEVASRGITTPNLGGQVISKLRYSAKPMRVGKFTIPSFPVEVGGKRVMVPAAELVVTEGDPRDTAYQPVRSLIDVPKRDYFVGETIDARVMFFDTRDEQPQFIQHVAKSSGPVLFKPSTRTKTENIIWEGKPVRAVTMPVQITPLTPGDAEVNCQVIVHVSRVNQGGRGILSQSTIDVPSVHFRVLPLPQVRPKGFTGAIGQFTLAQPRLSATEVQVGEPLVMTVALTGEGNLDGVPAPELEAAAEWNSYRPTSELQRDDDSSTGGTKIFTYTLVPKAEGRRGTPAIPFAYFDPVKKTFVDLTIPPQPFEVKPSPIPVATTTTASTAAEPPPVEPPRDAPPTMTGLAEVAGAWHSNPGPNLSLFLWLQAIPPVVLLSLWGWRKRVEYLAHNPEIIRRREARVAARRALQNARAAARRGDAGAFFEAGLSALRQAAAPLDSTDAGSLTREEVLRQLQSDERAAKAAAAIFETADVSRYARSASAATAESSRLLPELEHAVASLSSRR